MNKFEALGLNNAIVKAVTELGFESPTPIQEKVIPALLTGNTDLVALAQTGTGKTAAFGLPLISLIDFASRDTQAVILCPTRELCMQITRDLQSYTKYIDGANIVAVYGGASIDNQSRDIKKGAQIVVATPGRMNDMIDRRRVNLSNVRYAVLDEADEMLNMGFKEDLDTILSQTPQEKNTWLFSATMPDEVLRISKNYMTTPVEITAGTKNSGNENIEHVYYVVHARDKYPALKRIADSNPDIFAIVFCRTRIETQEIADKLIKDGYNADALHGDLSQSQRDHVMKRYRSRSLQMLIATDVAARGIDVQDVTHVINYALPDEIENYTHRSGRTARAGKKGVSIAIINMKEVGKIRIIERLIKTKFTQATVPTGFQACETQLFSLVKKIHEVEVNEKAIETYLPKIYDELKDLTREDIIKRFVSTEFNRFLDYYKNAPDLNVATGRDRPSVSVNGITKLFINLGELDNLDSSTMKEYISEVSGVATNLIVNIDVKSSFSFVEVKTEAAEIISGTFKNVQYNNRNVRIESRGDSGVEKRSFGGGNGGSNSYGERKSYGNRSDSRGGDRGGYSSRSGSGSGERKSYGSGSGSGERKTYSDRPERGGYAKRTSDSGNSSGERKSYSDRSDKGSSVKRTTSSESGERKSNFSREKRPRKAF
ncbi:MAG: DEAD/DEAH box helicase [Bacteroidia bacterium]|nr:DEAD/DEAH box helicase [Bacteroidia bacterium]